MADRYRAVFVEQQHSHRLAYDVTSADYNALLALDGDIIRMEHFHNARGCAGQEVKFAQHDFSDIYGMERVNVLLGADSFDYRLIVKVLWQRKLNQYSVDVLFFVELIDQREQFLLSC